MLLHYGIGGRSEYGIIRNPEVLCGRLLQGSVVKIRLHPFSSDSKENIRELSFAITEKDMLPSDFLDMFKKYPPSYKTYFGFTTKNLNNKGRYYIPLKNNYEGLFILSGEYKTDGKGAGRCSDADSSFLIKFGLLDNYFYSRSWPLSSVTSWENVPADKEDAADYLSIKNLNRDFRDSFASRVSFEYYLTDDWSPDFYRKQAKLGFIAITERGGDSERLMPQLQSDYAVLDWKDLVISRKVRKIINSGRLENEKITLSIDSDPGIVLKELKNHWRYSTWLTEKYINLIKELAESEETKKDETFQILGITLNAGEESSPVAGELGYVIGRTYTSLSGFSGGKIKHTATSVNFRWLCLPGSLRREGFLSGTWDIHIWIIRLHLGQRLYRGMSFLRNGMRRLNWN